MPARGIFLLACVALLVGSGDAFIGGGSAVPSAPAVQLKAQPKNPLLFQINTVCDPARCTEHLHSGRHNGRALTPVRPPFAESHHWRAD